jgi:outer membrane protein assembly factor BamB
MRMRIVSKLNNNTNHANLATQRGNFQRTGAYNTKELQQPSGLKWKISLNINPYLGPCEVCTPIVVNDSVAYFGHKGGFVVAVSINQGKVKWTFNTEEVSHEISSPTVFGNNVYIGYGRRLYALDKKNGGEVWNFKTNDFITTSPVVVDNYVCFTTEAGSLYSIDINTWQAKWIFEADGFFGRECSPAVDDRTVFFLGSDEYFHAIDINSGNEIWKSLIEYKAGTENEINPVIFDGYVYVGIMETLYVFECKTGEIKWKYIGETLPETLYGRFVTYKTTPAAYKGIVYYAVKNGLCAFDAKTGDIRWKYDTIWTPKEPIIVGGTVYFKADGHINAVDAKTGKLKWKFKTAAGTDGLVFDNGTAYFGGSDGYLYAIQ